MLVYNFSHYPSDLKKKVILAQHFISYLMAEKFIAGNSKLSKNDAENEFSDNFVYLK